jgi:uncharacterized protein YbjT (DUF2867 family)
MSEMDIVTGATGYSGKYITRRLLSAGRRVRTLTNHPARQNPFGSQIEVVPYHFEKPEELQRDLEGAATVYNTYWVRFPHGRHSFESAVANTRTLIQAAEQAGVRKFIHVSIANPSEDSPLAYYHGKAVLEAALTQSSLSWVVIRPTVIFGLEDILINNIAWLVRHFPVFVVPGRGDYKLQPVFVEDLAQIAIDAAGRHENVIIDAVGPETYSFSELVQLIARTLGRKIHISHVSPALAYLLTRLLGLAVHDVILTREEIKGLMANLLVSNQPPLGWTKLSSWLEQNAARVGGGYTSELGRHFR